MIASLLVLLATSSAENATEINGFYSWNWGSGSHGASGANVGVAFTGLVDVKQAIAGYPPGATWCCPALKEADRFISLGGGNAAGEFTAEALQSISGSLDAVVAANYTGVVFDVEEVIGPASTMVSAFAAAFAACKRSGLKVAVTTSHSAPYQVDAPAIAVELVKAWASDGNIDILSPQLYSSGMEASPEFAETSSCAPDCSWKLYVGAKARFAPSIVDASQLPAVRTFFQPLGISVDGFFQWKQTTAVAWPWASVRRYGALV